MLLLLVCTVPFFVLRQPMGLLVKLFGVHSSCVSLRIDWECCVAGYVLSAWSCNVIFLFIGTRLHNTSPVFALEYLYQWCNHSKSMDGTNKSREAAVLESAPSGGKPRRWVFTGGRGQALGSCSAFLVVPKLWLHRVLSSPVWLLLHTAGCTWHPKVPPNLC